jgi:hypothetical protein
MLRELQTNRHRPSNSLGSPTETSFPPFDSATSYPPPDQPASRSNLPPLPSYSSLPSLSDISASPPGETSPLPAIRPPPTPASRPTPNSQPTTTTHSQASWGNLLSRTAAQTKPGLHGPAFFQKPTAPTSKSTESPLPSPSLRPSHDHRSVSNPSSNFSTTASSSPKPSPPSSPPLEPPQPPRNKKRPSFPKGPNSNIPPADPFDPYVESPPRTPSEQPRPLTVADPFPPPRPPFKNNSSASGGSWDALLAQHSRSSPRSSPPVEASMLPPASTDRPSNPLATTTTTAISTPWENLLALAANSSVPPQTSSSTASKSRLPNFKVPFTNSSSEPSSSRNQSASPTRPPVVLPPLDFDFTTAPIVSPPLPPPSNHSQSSSSSSSSRPPPTVSIKPTLIGKQENRSLQSSAAAPKNPTVAGKSGGGGMISGFVRAPEGKKELRPGQKVQMATSACICCAATLQYPLSVTSFRCTVCGTISDLGLSDRRAAGLPKESDPRPLTLERFQSLLDAARSSNPSPSPSVEALGRDAYDGYDSDVEEAKTVEGGDSDGEGVAEVVGRRDGGGSSEGKEEWWAGLAFELEMVFSHWSSLCGSFSMVHSDPIFPLCFMSFDRGRLADSFPLALDAFHRTMNRLSINLPSLSPTSNPSSLSSPPFPSSCLSPSSKAWNPSSVAPVVGSTRPSLGKASAGSCSSSSSSISGRREAPRLVRASSSGISVLCRTSRTSSIIFSFSG